jgi:hypothetical protein
MRRVADREWDLQKEAEENKNLERTHVAFLDGLKGRA